MPDPEQIEDGALEGEDILTEDDLNSDLNTYEAGLEEIEGPQSDAVYERMVALEDQLSALRGDSQEGRDADIAHQITELASAAGYPFTDEEAEYLGNESLKHLDEHGRPDVWAAARAVGERREAEYIERVEGRIEKEIDRPLLAEEREQIAERASESDTEDDPMQVWKELHPDGKDPLSFDKGRNRADYVNTRLDELDNAPEVKQKSDFDLNTRKGRAEYITARAEDRVAEPEAGAEETTEATSAEAQED